MPKCEGQQILIGNQFAIFLIGNYIFFFLMGYLRQTIFVTHDFSENVEELLNGSRWRKSVWEAAENWKF